MFIKKQLSLLCITFTLPCALIAMEPIEVPQGNQLGCFGSLKQTFVQNKKKIENKSKLIALQKSDSIEVYKSTADYSRHMRLFKEQAYNLGVELHHSAYLGNFEAVKELYKRGASTKVGSPLLAQCIII